MRRYATLLLPAGLVACQGPPPGASYFPLEAGHHWTYEVKTERDNNTVDRQSRTLRTLGEAPLEGGGRAWRRRSDDGVDYFLRHDETGIFRVAAKSDLDAEPSPDKAPRYVLKQPLAVGTEWQAATTAYLLERRAEFPREIRNTQPPVPMTYRIEALGETVETRAGRFTDCLRVQGRAQMRLFADPVVGWRDLPLVTTEWYCKGVGLARLVREEPGGSNFLSGGTLTMELTSWQ